MIAYADGGVALRERIQMATGALKVLGGVWPIASAILQQVNEVARGIFSFRPQENSTRSTSIDHAAAAAGGDDGITFTNDDSWLDEMIDRLPEQDGTTDAVFQS